MYWFSVSNQTNKSFETDRNTFNQRQLTIFLEKAAKRQENQFMCSKREKNFHLSLEITEGKMIFNFSSLASYYFYSP